MRSVTLLISLLLLRFISQAQTAIQPILKIGYADQYYIYSNLPEYKVVNNEVEVSAAKYQSMLKEKYTLYQQKIDVYQTDVKNQAASAILRDKENELQNL